MNFISRPHWQESSTHRQMNTARAPALGAVVVGRLAACAASFAMAMARNVAVKLVQKTPQIPATGSHVAAERARRDPKTPSLPRRPLAIALLRLLLLVRQLPLACPPGAAQQIPIPSCPCVLTFCTASSICSAPVPPKSCPGPYGYLKTSQITESRT